MASQTLNSERLAQARRVVLKIGSTLIVEKKTGSLQRTWLDALCADVAAI